jgi:4-hydroxyacetophenone monooxygenase
LSTETTLPEGFSVLIIGLGASGLLAGIRLREVGIPFEIVEKNAGVGGAWFENTYPGCRVDVASHFYSYSFERNNDFSQYYTRQPELQAYFRKTMADHGIGDHVTWNTEATRAVWDEDNARWTVTLDGPEGRRPGRLRW